MRKNLCEIKRICGKKIIKEIIQIFFGENVFEFFSCYVDF